MKLPVANLGAVVAAWMDKELIPKAVGWQKVVTVMAGVGIANNAAGVIQQYLPAMQMLGFADEAGNILVEPLLVAARTAFEKTGKVPLPGGIIVGIEDVESIVETAKQFAS